MNYKNKEYKRKKISITVPNPVFGIEKVNGEVVVVVVVVVVFSGDAVVVGVGILKLKPVDDVESLLAVVVVGFVKLNNGNVELVVVVVVVGGRI
jgi:hypothetical protein